MIFIQRDDNDEEEATFRQHGTIHDLHPLRPNLFKVYPA